MARIRRGNSLKVAGIILVILGCGVLMWGQYTEYNGEPRDPAGGRMGPGFAGPNGEPGLARREGRGQRMREFARAVGLSPDQEREINRIREEAFEKFGDGPPPPDMFERINAVLTPEQREKAREYRERRDSMWRQEREMRMNDRQQEARASMPPEEFDQWLKDRENMTGGRFGQDGASLPPPPSVSPEE